MKYAECNYTVSFYWEYVCFVFSGKNEFWFLIKQKECWSNGSCLGSRVVTLALALLLGFDGLSGSRGWEGVDQASPFDWVDQGNPSLLG